MATFETKFGLGDKAWALNFEELGASQCKRCGVVARRMGYKVRKVVITQIAWRVQWFCPDYSWRTASGRKERGSGTAEEIYATRAEAFKALKQEQKKKK